MNASLCLSPRLTSEIGSWIWIWQIVSGILTTHCRLHFILGDMLDPVIERDWYWHGLYGFHLLSKDLLLLLGIFGQSDALPECRSRLALSTNLSKLAFS